MTRPTRIRRLLAGLLTCLSYSAFPSPVQAGEGTTKPNVVMIFVDDLNCRLGAYGDKVVKSPNLDALARSGMRFDRAYCANPVCMPSRTAILTGLRSDTTKTFDNNAGCFRPNVPDAVTLPQLFARSGYAVVVVGKTFFSHGSDDPETLKILTRLPPVLPDKKEPPYVDRLLVEENEREAVRKMLGKKQTYWGPLGGTDSDMHDGQVALAAVKFLKESKKGPFFLAVGFLRPHLPLVVPKKYFDLYPLESLPVPPETTEHLTKVEDVDLGLKHAVNRLERERNTGRLNIGPDLSRRITQAYYASISFMDAQVGVVLQALKDAGLEKNTVIVLVSDHGFLLGEHGCWAKSSLYEESVRAPLLIAAPGVTKAGTATRRLVEHVDIYPTLADLCGLKAPAGLEGISLVPLIKEPERPWKQAVFSVDMCGERMVRTEQWKLIVLPESKVQKAGGLLFDVEKDPRENTNLYESPEHRGVVEGLRKLLEQKSEVRGQKSDLRPLTSELPGFQLDGTRWTYKDDKVSMQGILLKPEGKGPFPAVVISHGLGGNAQQFGLSKGRELVKWGMVCIAPDYTHSQPKGDRKEFGASPENIRRAVKCIEILESFPDVDKKRIGAFGNSMGAFLTIALAAEHPDRIRAAAITAGGVAKGDGFPAPSLEKAAKVRVPLLILHGSADTTVPPERSAWLKEILDKNKIANERQVFEGIGHGLHSDKAEDVYRFLRTWFEKHGVVKKGA